MGSAALIVPLSRSIGVSRVVCMIGLKLELRELAHSIQDMVIGRDPAACELTRASTTG